MKFICLLKFGEEASHYLDQIMVVLVIDDSVIYSGGLSNRSSRSSNPYS